jgi:hypothetical protein
VSDAPELRGSGWRQDFARAELMRLHSDDLLAEALDCNRRNDPDRLRAILAEHSVVLANMRELRREQILRELEPPAPRLPWWRRLFGAHARNQKQGRP